MVLYHGEFYGGFTHGQGVLFHENGVKRYEGDWYNGEPKGSGKWFDETGTPESQEFGTATSGLETED